MSTKVAEIAKLFNQDTPASWVSSLWDKFHQQRSGKIEEWLELRNFVFATDTTTTTNSSLPWKNSTTVPKLCQVRDNLHSNYISALFPNDNWLQWQAYSKDAALKDKANTIRAYMENKTREGHFRTEVSKLLYDYIDSGNAFCTTAFESNSKELADGTIVPAFIGPKVKRISYLDIVFNPLADSFDSSFKIIRSVKSIGELRKLAMTEPEQSYWSEVLERREGLKGALGGCTSEDFNKAVGYQADGFGDMKEYFMSDNVEILEFYGDYHDDSTGELHTNKVITIADRSTTARIQDIPSWMGTSPIRHVGWRFRPDNLWSMGPLDNLVGMQYRIDHLENLKADAMDLLVHPPLVVQGGVEEFQWGPGEEIHVDEGGSITEVTKGLNGVLAADSQIQSIKDEMELMAGAPREAMGIRTPGEKTATEVNSLQNAAGRIFQEKITNFEIELLEPVLNDMLETAARNMETNDLIRVMDDDLGVQQFIDITREDITANGKLRPIGARHFGKQAQDLQNIISIMNSPIGQMIAPHTSGKALTKFVSDITSLHGYDIFRDNVALMEQQDTQRLMNQAQEDLAAEANVTPGVE